MTKGISIKTVEGKFIEDTLLTTKLLTLHKHESIEYQGKTVIIEDIECGKHRDYLIVKIEGNEEIAKRGQDELLDNLDRPKRHNINPANRPSEMQVYAHDHENIGIKEVEDGKY